MGRSFTLTDDNFENKSGVMGYNESHFKQFLVTNLFKSNEIEYLNYNIFGEYGTEHEFDFGNKRWDTLWRTMQTQIQKNFIKKLLN